MNKDVLFVLSSSLLFHVFNFRMLDLIFFTVLSFNDNFMFFIFLNYFYDIIIVLDSVEFSFSLNECFFATEFVSLLVTFDLVFLNFNTKDLLICLVFSVLDLPVIFLFMEMYVILVYN